MKLSTLFATLALVIIVSGCASNQHVYSADGKCLTCWNNPVTGNPINHDGQANQGIAAQESQAVESTTNSPTEHKLALTVPVNVDMAFLKIKKEFNYYTDQEIQQEWGSMAKVKMQTFAYAYDATPSVYYHMRAACNHDGIRAIIDSQIEKQSDKESNITITYWLSNKSVNANQFGESLKTRIKKVLNI
jgi:hypothetical protein